MAVTDVEFEVQFRSTAFNVTEPREYFINDCCFGDDLCKWLIAELRERGHSTDGEPGQEDFGWYFNFAVGGQRHCFLVGFQPNDPAAGDQWLGVLERDRGLLASLFGSRKRGIEASAVAAIDQILRSTDIISNVSWGAVGPAATL